MGPIAKTFPVREMKLVRCDSKPAKIASNVIQRDETVVSVKGCVFQPLRHYWARELLEFHRKSGNRVSVSVIMPLSDAREKHLANEIEDAGVGSWTSQFCGIDGDTNVAQICFRDAGEADVSAVHGKAGDHLGERFAQAVESEVASVPFGERDPGELMGQHVQLAGQSNANNEFSTAIGQIVKIDLVADNVSVNALETVDGCRVDKQTVHQIRKVVARCAA